MAEPVWAIVREAFSGARPELRSQIRWIAAVWVLLVALQVWDSRDGRGVAGAAEFVSVLLGSGGVAMLGIAHTLQRTMDDAPAVPRPPGDAAALRQILIALPAIGFAAGAALAGAALLMVMRALLGSQPFVAIAGTAVYGGFFVLAGLTVTRSARTLFRHAADHAALAADARAQAAAAQLAALQARMNPHFLFNALNTVASLVRTDPRAAEHVIENLSDVLRQTLDRSTNVEGALSDEIAYVRAYLALEQERWGERLRVDWNVDDVALACRLPPLVLQPLVENALRHGLGARTEGGTIRISVRLAGGRLVLSVEDDGEGFPPGWKEGTGMGNLRQRLATLYGEEAALEVETAGPGARVTVRLPCGAPEATGGR